MDKGIEKGKDMRERNARWKKAAEAFGAISAHWDQPTNVLDDLKNGINALQGDESFRPLVLDNIRTCWGAMRIRARQISQTPELEARGNAYQHAIMLANDTMEEITASEYMHYDEIQRRLDAAKQNFIDIFTAMNVSLT